METKKQLLSRIYDLEELNGKFKNRLRELLDERKETEKKFKVKEQKLKDDISDFEDREQRFHEEDSRTSKVFERNMRNNTEIYNKKKLERKEFLDAIISIKETNNKLVMILEQTKPTNNK